MALSKGQLIHIESLDLDNYLAHVRSQFIQYAASGIYRLGKIDQKYTVLDRSSNLVFSTLYAKDALYKYIELIKENS